MTSFSQQTRLATGEPLPLLSVGSHVPRLAWRGAKNHSSSSRVPRRMAKFSIASQAPRSGDHAGEVKVLSLVASCVEANNSLAIFEEFAGRSAMVGFAVAVCAELALPSSGLFGAWGSDSYNVLMGSAATLIAGAVMLAASNKGQASSNRFQEAVLASLTALTRSASSITQRNVDSAVDYVFEQVFSSSVLDTYDFDLLDIDDFV